MISSQSEGEITQDGILCEAFSSAVDLPEGQYLAAIDDVFSDTESWSSSDSGVEACTSRAAPEHDSNIALGDENTQFSGLIQTVPTSSRIGDNPSSADVLVENFRPDVKKRLQIDHESLREFNPKLISQLVSLVGFPMAVKPSREGSSIGVSKVQPLEQLFHLLQMVC